MTAKGSAVTDITPLRLAELAELRCRARRAPDLGVGEIQSPSNRETTRRRSIVRRLAAYLLANPASRKAQLRRRPAFDPRGGKSPSVNVQAVRKSQMIPVAVVADTAVIDRQPTASERGATTEWKSEFVAMSMS